jgi:hypothetical protein
MLSQNQKGFDGSVKPAAANPGWRIQICREPGWFSDIILSGVAEPERWAAESI